METYDKYYKKKLEKLINYKYFEYKFHKKMEYYFKKYNVSNYKYFVIEYVDVIDTSMPLTVKLTSYGMLVLFVTGITLISAVLLFVYNKTERHKNHIKEIAQEFGIDESEVKTITSFKLF